MSTHALGTGGDMGASTEGAWWVPRWRLWPSSLRPAPQVWAQAPLYSHFHGGIFFDVSPLWIAPAPYIGVTPAPHPRLHLYGTTAQTHRAIIP